MTETPHPAPPPSTASPAQLRRRRRLAGCLGLGMLALLCLAAWHWRLGLQARGLVGILRDAGPVAFFGAMALLPALGFPIAVFNMAAGPAFAPELGVTTVCLLASLAISINVTLTYWLSRYALRPLVGRLLAWLGYSIPSIPPQRTLSIAFLIRITPGPPFFIQGCAMGVAELPFAQYMLASCSVATAYAVAVIIGGDALMRGDVRIGLLAFAALGVLILATRLFHSRTRNDDATGSDRTSED